MNLEADPIETVGVGIIGLGNRGPGITETVAKINENAMPNCEINAVCDVVEDRVQEMASTLQEDYGMDPATYSAGVSEDEWEDDESFREDDLDKMVDSGWKQLVERNDIDLVYIFTHHRSHAEMCVYAMDKGKHVAVAVPAATTIKECWDLVQASERNQVHCVQNENYNYREEELWVLNMVQEGVFDEITFARGGYIHNLVGTYFMGAYGPPINWRSRMHMEEKGDTYPTHGVGPIAWYLELLRGDRMESLVAQESPEAALSEYAQNELGPGDEFYGQTDWANGDTTRSLIKTNKGLHIEEQLDVKTTRTTSGLSHNTLAGTGGFHESTTHHGSSLSIGNEGHNVLDDETYDEYRDEYEHPVWESLGKQAEGYGHGGGDYIMVYRLIDALNKGRPVDQNVYDAVHWSAIRPLSRISINHGSRPVKFPSFTREDWEKNRELPINKYTEKGLELSTDVKFVTGGETFELTATFTNDDRTVVEDVQLDFDAPSGWDAMSTTETSLDEVAVDESVTVAWEVTAPPEPDSDDTIEVTAAYVREGTTIEISNRPSVSVPPAPPTGDTYLSDHEWTTATIGWGSIGLDESVDGNTLSIGGETYEKGIGIHAESEIVYYLNGNVSQFVTDVGIDDEVGDEGNVKFRVLGDDEVLIETDVLTGEDSAVSLDVDISGVDVLELVVTEGTDGTVDYDHANWADARVFK
ncbi:NPCBM/NEW2 domain-containing protein (plasmid) [Natrinema zhouii]|uniref:NPCBM/NEW2 domain-containing protein n=1 Tax=Natrinema zhouii TaxID=1710539 RepID=UPI001CFF58D3|nr:NPCBM/NEW2 domain-containing protein [Natrinema zhouii]UHQ98829.1 NPCBM/NEW2 domain-containing protein [Natrinema zhouii]